ncbi:patatin-like phospholipase family protein [Planctomycetota bacterium]
MSRIQRAAKPTTCLVLTTLLLSLSGCMQVAHRGVPLPKELSDKAQIAGIPNARIWGDEQPPKWGELTTASEQTLAARFSGIMNREHRYLALSGGGANGAFGAGLLAGWTAAGTRPEFTIVTGVSTGSLIAPFAFLGSEYDTRLKELYTQFSTDDMVKKKKLWNIIRNDGAVSVAPMKAILAEFYNEDVVDAIAREGRKGRLLRVGTTNLDAGRPVIWDIAAIAASEHPDRVELIQRIILASCSIPVGFPPVFFEVEANGQTYDEMHVDGGVANQVFLYPAEIKWQPVLDKFKVKGQPRVYVIRNSHVHSHWQETKPRLTAIAGRSVDSLIRTQGIGDMYRIYLESERDNLDFNLAFIPPEFTEKPKETFDVEIMKELYDLGYKMARDGYVWHKTPPEFVTHDDQ